MRFLPIDCGLRDAWGTSLMRTIKLRKKFPLHPSFLLLFAWFMVTGQVSAFFIFVGVVVTHELGHYFVAKKLGYKLDSFFLAPYGVSLNYKEKTFEGSDEFKIAVAGPLVNIVLSVVAVALWWIFPVLYGFTDIFVSQSVLLALFNLLPAYPLDGGRIFISLLSGRTSRKKAVKIIIVANIIFTLLFLALFIYSCTYDYNPTFALAACFMLGGLIQTKSESKYEKLNLFSRKIKEFSRPYMLVINFSTTLHEAIKHIEPNRFTVFYVVGEGQTKLVDEKVVLKWSLRFPLSTTFAEIFKT